MNKPIVTIYNRHAEGCGTPPSLDNVDRYISYFETYDGGQWIFTYDWKTKANCLYGGEIDWEDLIITDIELQSMILDTGACLWLAGCLRTTKQPEMAFLIIQTMTTRSK